MSAIPAIRRRAIFGRPCGTWIILSTLPSAEQAAKKVWLRAPAPKGASGCERLTASPKRCPDTKPEFLLRNRIFPQPANLSFHFWKREALVFRNRTYTPFWRSEE